MRGKTVNPPAGTSERYPMTVAILSPAKMLNISRDCKSFLLAPIRTWRKVRIEKV